MGIKIYRKDEERCVNCKSFSGSPKPATGWCLKYKKSVRKSYSCSEFRYPCKPQYEKPTHYIEINPHS